MNRKTVLAALSVMLIVALAVTISTLLNPSVPARATPLAKSFSMVVGVGTHGNLSSETKSLQSGVKYYRTDINLGNVQVSQLGNESRGYGARYLGILDYETLPGGSSDRNWNLSTWNASVANAIADYPYVSTWEIWNEPWVTNFQTGYMNGSAHNYYLVIRAAYAIIKSRQPNSTIVCFGGAPISDYYIFEWYSQVWGYGASDYCDAVSIHAYPQGASLLNQSGTEQQWDSGLSAYENLTHKPIWITETGMPSASTDIIAGYSPYLQDAFLVQDLAFFNSFPYVKRVYWYDLWGLSDGGANNFGLLNLSDPGSNVQTPAWQSFLAAYNSSTSKNATEP